jgi:hypothetical protein
MSLNRLPDELIIHILDNLTQALHCAPAFPDTKVVIGRKGVIVRSVAALSACSHRLRRLGEPYLYYYFDCGNERSLLAYAQTILRRPELAQHVQFADLTFRSRDLQSDIAIPVFSQDNLAHARTVILTIGIIDEQEVQTWIEGIKEGHWDAIVSMLMLMFSHLHTLNLNGYQRDNDDGDFAIYESMMARLEASQNQSEISPLLQVLEHAFVSHWDSEFGVDIDSFLPFLRLPNIKSFKGFAVASEAYSIPVSTARLTGSITSPITSLKMANSNLDDESLESLFRICPCLEEFLYEEGGATVGYTIFCPSLIGQALGHVKHSLKSLEIIDNEGKEDFGEPLQYTTLGSLVPFEKLEKISVSACMLAGSEEKDTAQRFADKLPSSLVTLCLNNCEKEILGQIWEILAIRTQRLPKLNNIVLRFEDRPYLLPSGSSLEGPDKEEIEERLFLRKSCEEAGIKLAFEPQGFHDDLMESYILQWGKIMF